MTGAFWKTAAGASVVIGAFVVIERVWSGLNDRAARVVDEAGRPFDWAGAGEVEALRADVERLRAVVEGRKIES